MTYFAFRIEIFPTERVHELPMNVVYIYIYAEADNYKSGLLMFIDNKLRITM
jgi:hypothetical protein